MNTPILSLININKRISKSFKLSNINIDFYPGRICAVVGENGSGKSSLMKVISGIISPDSGEIKFNNKSVNFKSIRDSKKLGIYYVPQETNLFDNLTVAENIYLSSVSFDYPPYHQVDYNSMVYMAEKIFLELDVELDPQEYVKNIGLSQRQILSFVKAYVANGKFTIFDEPSSALTDVENDILFKIINILKSRGSSIILISHKIDRIKKICDRIAVLKNGSIVDQGDMKDFSNERIIRIIAESGHISKYPKLYFNNPNEILKVNNLNYRDSLKNISFSLKKQEIVGITGNANSGKNKLIESLFGMVKPDSGEIILDGNKVQLNHPNEAMAKGFALLPEDKIKYSLFEHLDLTHNLTMSSLKRFSKYTILDHHIMTTVAESYVSKLRIYPGHPEDNVISYSGGNQQKVIFAKSIMHFAKIYLLDEPTRGIDVATKNDIYNIMNNLLINGSSIILFSSDFNEILGMCDRILILSNGKIIAELNGNDATKEEIVYYLTL